MGKKVQGFLSPATLYVCTCWLLDASSLEARHNKMDQEMNGPGRSFPSMYDTIQ